MTTALVIGYGNEWRQDDGAGPEVARRIEASELPGVRAIVAHQLTPEMAQTLSTAERAYFVDAFKEAKASLVEIAPLSPHDATSLASHALEPAALLALSQILYGRAPRAWLVAIEGQQFDLGDGRSALAELGVDQAVQWITASLRDAEPFERTS